MVKHLHRHLRKIKKMKSVHTLSLFAIVAGVGVGMFLAMQPATNVEAIKTNPQCVAAKKECDDEYKEKKGEKCPPIVNKKDCKDSGYPCEGKCVYTTAECKGIGTCSGNKDPGKPKEEPKKDDKKGPEMPKMPEPPKKEPKPPEEKKGPTDCPEGAGHEECLKQMKDAEKPKEKSAWEKAQDALKGIVDKGKEVLGITPPKEEGASVSYGTEDAAGKDIGKDPASEEKGKLDTVTYGEPTDQAAEDRYEDYLKNHKAKAAKAGVDTFTRPPLSRKNYRSLTEAEQNALNGALMPKQTPKPKWWQTALGWIFL